VGTLFLFEAVYVALCLTIFSSLLAAWSCTYSCPTKAACTFENRSFVSGDPSSFATFYAPPPFLTAAPEQACFEGNHVLYFVFTWAVAPLYCCLCLTFNLKIKGNVAKMSRQKMPIYWPIFLTVNLQSKLLIAAVTTAFGQTRTHAYLVLSTLAVANVMLVVASPFACNLVSINILRTTLASVCLFR
jgi:hypothetical protein